MFERERSRLPKTTGKWIAIVRGKKSRTPKLTGWIECFRHPLLGWVSIPGSGRYIAVK